MLRSELQTQEVVRPAALVAGELRVPGDKSIAHRALILGSLAEDDSTIRGIPESEDVRATVACLRSLGVRLTPLASLAPPGRSLRITPSPSGGGPGWGLATPHGVLDCANSGTTMRLLLGLLAGSRISATLDGDDSLRRRPMARVIDPLRRMGARIESREGLAPLTVLATQQLQGRHYELPVASAQVKSAILLAGLAARGPTTIVEPLPTRDHTERLLTAMGADLRSNLPPPVGEGPGGAIVIDLRPSHRPLRRIDLTIPGDFSSAAYWMAAAALRPDWSITIRDVGLNPTRTEFLRILERMGAEVQVDVASAGIEPTGSVRVVGGPLNAVELAPAEVAGIIDEIPALLALATQATGVTSITGAAELRVKESDRIAAMAEGLRRMGASVEERSDGLSVEGPAPLRGATVASKGDHRIAMALAIAGLAASSPTRIEDADAVAVSYPEFFRHLREVTDDL
ncbi:MAG TPA: 3-phosphoshikimate 1-carboxyvinyltransferase [Candidatus Dormibacteraeota bacterium]|nr:3-phosphoshikimate 1-carboxyvinyltransferase [Candidatus Dormibacteraeota bacterium]